MAITIKQTESAPVSYPDVSGLSAAAAALDPAMIWQRIESYIVHRFTARDVTWVVEGAGDWRAPLTPASVATTEIWQDDAWQSVTLSPSAFGGYVLPGCGPYRFTGAAGPEDVPEAVNEAFRRLAEYLAPKRGKPGATSERVEAGSVKVWHTRDAEWVARALQFSGAADMLRPYRRA